VWAPLLLEAMRIGGITWRELDRPALWAALFDGFRGRLRQIPEDPAAVARELEALVRFADRLFGVPHAGACCAYLRSRTAVLEIRMWVRPPPADARQRGGAA
jgi:hypothetical protein